MIASYTDPARTTIRIEDGGVRFVPVDPGNRDYAALVAAGVAVADFAPPPAPVPPVVSRFQARAALLSAGTLDAVQAAVDGSDDPLVTLAWTEAVEFRRDSPTIAALAAGIGLTEAQIDDLFRQAAAISA